MDYAKKFEKELDDLDIRVELDSRAEKIGYKIREAQMEKVNYMIIVGEKELNEGNISVRSRDLGDLGFKNTEDFLKELNEEIDSKKTN